MSDLFSGVDASELIKDVSKLERIEDWDQYFLSMTFLAARRSKDPSTKTGCVVVRDRQVLTTGYNGFPRGCDDSPELYADRDLKYRRVVHCDTNAIISAAREGIKLLGATMYLTGPPCTRCTTNIINAGIIEVVWPKVNKFESDPETGARWEGDALDSADQESESLLLLRQAGVAYRRA
jgi:dCMP deaminase